MAVVNTTDIIDSSIFLKAKLEKNMVGDNYYIENLQDKRNKDWEYRYNRVDIEEELDKQIIYTHQLPNYTSIESVVTNVKSDKGEDLGSDWAKLAFKDLKHKCDIGMRYRFSLDFPNIKGMSEDEKHYNTSIWICVNRSPIKAGNSCTVRRCNTALTFLGSPDGKISNATEIHMEPCVLDNELKYLQVYYNLSVPIPQSEWYATMQLNYFSNCVKINDRFLFGTMNNDGSKENNSVYKVKAVIKAETNHTFIKDSIDEMESTPLVVLALDKDLVGPDDDFKNRIASQCPVYKVTCIEPDKDSSSTDDGEYRIDLNPIVEAPKKSFFTIRTSSERGKDYEVALYNYKGEIVDTNFEFDYELEYMDKGFYDDYFTFTQNGNKFNIICNNDYNDGSLLVNAVCTIPSTGETLVKQYSFKLKGLG